MSKKNERKKRRRRIEGKKCPTCRGFGRIAADVNEYPAVLCPMCFGLGRVKDETLNNVTEH